MGPTSLLWLTLPNTGKVPFGYEIGISDRKRDVNRTGWAVFQPHLRVAYGGSNYGRWSDLNSLGGTSLHCQQGPPKKNGTSDQLVFGC